MERVLGPYSGPIDDRRGEKRRRGKDYAATYIKGVAEQHPQKGSGTEKVRGDFPKANGRTGKGNAGNGANGVRWSNKSDHRTMATIFEEVADGEAQILGKGTGGGNKEELQGIQTGTTDKRDSRNNRTPTTNSDTKTNGAERKATSGQRRRSKDHESTARDKIVGHQSG